VILFDIPGAAHLTISDLPNERFHLVIVSNRKCQQGCSISKPDGYFACFNINNLYKVVEIKLGKLNISSRNAQ
jgi:hypothetical protein